MNASWRLRKRLSREFARTSQRPRRRILPCTAEVSGRTLAAGQRPRREYARLVVPGSGVPDGRAPARDGGESASTRVPSAPPGGGTGRAGEGGRDARPGTGHPHGPPLRGSTPSRNRPRSSGSRSTTADPHHRAQSRRFRSSRPPQPHGSERPHRQDRQHPCVDAAGASPGWAQPPLGPPPPDPKRGKEPKNNSAPATTLGCAFPGRALHLSRLAGVGQRRERDGVWN